MNTWPEGWHLVLLCSEDAAEARRHLADRSWQHLPRPVQGLTAWEDVAQALEPLDDGMTLNHHHDLLPPEDVNRGLEHRLQWWSRLARVVSEWQQSPSPCTLVVLAPSATLQALARLCLGLPLGEPDPLWLQPGARLHLLYQPQQDRWMLLALDQPALLATVHD